MRLALPLVPPFTDDFAVADDDRAHHGVRMRRSAAALGELECTFEESGLLARHFGARLQPGSGVDLSAPPPHRVTPKLVPGGGRRAGGPRPRRSSFRRRAGPPTPR